MATKEEYAQLSLYVYNATGLDDNRPLLLAGWEELEYQRDGGLGFSYGVFRRIGTTEVVVAYAGTNQDIDWVANVKNGIGLSSTQTTEAVLAYLTAKQQYGSNVSFNEPTDGSDDVIFAGAGVDWVHGEYGDDYIDGGSDDDVLFGQRGRDDIFGGTGTSRFKSNAREQRSCRTRKAAARGHVPGHTLPLPSASRNEALQ